MADRVSGISDLPRIRSELSSNNLAALSIGLKEGNSTMTQQARARCIGAALQNRSNRRSLLSRGLALTAAGTLGSLGSGRVASAQSTDLTFMHWGSLLEQQVLETTIARFNDEHADIQVEQQHTPGDYDTRLNTLVAANELPDLFYIQEQQALEWALEGRVLDMTPYLDEYPGFEDRLPQTFYYFEPERTVGSMLAIEMTTMFYNKDLFDEADVPYPPAEASEAYTWDAFVEAAKQLTLDNEGRNAADADFDPDNIRQYGVTFPRGWTGWYPLVRSNSGDITDGSGMQYTLNSPEAIDVFQKLQDLTYVHHVAPTPTQSENIPAADVALQTRRVAMSVAGQWSLLDIAAAGFNFSVGVLPRFQEPYTVMFCNITAVNPDTEDLDAALEFYLFHNNPAANIDPFASGLWMPLERKYYEEEEFIKQWTDNEAHPPEYRTAVMDYTLNHAVQNPAVVFRDFVALESRIGSGLGNLWSGESTAEEALNELEGVIQPLLKGKYPN